MSQQPDFGTPLVHGKTDQSVFPFHFTLDEFRPIVMQDRSQQIIYKSKPKGYFRFLPAITPETDIGMIVDRMVETDYEYDFVWATCFHPEFIAAMIYHGFLVIGDADPMKSVTHYYPFQWLLPKLHVDRCVMDWSRFKVHKNHIKNSNKFTMTINRDYAAVLKGCIRQHSDAWLYPNLRKAMQIMHDTNDKRLQVHLHSVEVWMKKDDMVLNAKAVEKDNLRAAQVALLLKEKQEHEESDKLNAEHVEASDTDAITTTAASATTTTTTTTATTKKKATTTNTTTTATKGKKTTTAAKKPLKKKTTAAATMSKEEKERLTWEFHDDHPDRHPSLSTQLGDDYYLVAGELGVTIGSCYVSLTGFRNQYIDHCGTIQLYSLGNYLLDNGYTMWDLGMDMPYKAELGAVSIPRSTFVSEFRNVRDQPMPDFAAALNDLAEAERQSLQQEEDQRVEQVNKKNMKFYQRKLQKINRIAQQQPQQEEQPQPQPEEKQEQQQEQQQQQGSQGQQPDPVVDQLTPPELITPRQIPNIGVSCRSLLKMNPPRPPQPFLTTSTKPSPQGAMDDNNTTEQAKTSDDAVNTPSNDSS